MKDIDFDELDRAVSSLMGSVPKDNPVKDTDGDGVIGGLSDTATATPNDESQIANGENEEASDRDIEPDVVEKPETVESLEEPEQPPMAPSRGISPPSRGRFMDMVRPSREMRRSSSLMSRQGVTLQPSSVQADDEAVNMDVEKRPLEASNADLAAMVHELEDTASVASSFGQPADTPISQEETIDSVDQAEDTAPLSSPFLPDAKVEKRPLGRSFETAVSSESVGEESENVDISSADTASQEEETLISPNKDAQRPEEPLPAELDSKLLSIETEDSTFHQQETETPVEHKTETMGAPLVASPVSVPTQATPSFAADTRRTMAAASIPQQYKLEAGDADDEPAAGAIYDAQPLTHPAKSTPGWVWVLGIIGVLALGAAGGAAVYFLGLL